MSLYIERLNYITKYRTHAFTMLFDIQVNYETFRGWRTDLSQIRRFEDLPATAQLYLKRVEQLVRVPVSWIGVGPGRLVRGKL